MNGPKSKRQAFVIMPFKKPIGDQYEQIYRLALEAAGFRPIRADEVYGPSAVILQIQKSIVESDLILCDLSDKNPNVLYELGMAHAIGKPSIIVSRQLQDIPFDLQHLRVILYDRDEQGWQKSLADRIASAARSLDESRDPWPPPLLPGLRGNGLPGSGRRDLRLAPPAMERPTNLGFDGSVVGNMPYGWFNSFGQVAGVSTRYLTVVEPRADGHRGACARFENLAAEDEEFGSLMQRIPAAFLAGRTVRLEGQLKCEQVRGWAGLWLRADGHDVPNLFFDNMSRNPLKGTTDWTACFIDSLLPESTEWLNYGIVLSGPGTLWSDDFSLRLWDKTGRWETV
jgi:hypothetical protein